MPATLVAPGEEEEETQPPPRLLASWAGCNAVPHAASWSSRGVLAFGAGPCVALSDPVGRGGAHRWLRGHHGRVNAVCWSPCGEWLASGATDGSIYVWRVGLGDEPVLTSVRLGDDETKVDGVVAVALVVVPSLATGAGATPTPGSDPTPPSVVVARMDGMVEYWMPTVASPTEWCVAQSWRQPTHELPLCVAAAPANQAGRPLVVFVGCVDRRVHLWTSNGSNGFLQPAGALGGHDDWIRSVAVRSEQVASASQDGFLRVWRLVPPSEVEDLDVRLHGHPWAVRLDALLAAHSGWVLGVQWHPRPDESRLLSASMDRSVIEWAPGHGGIWAPVARMGEVGGDGGGLGYVGCAYSPDGGHVLAHGYRGDFRLWQRVPEDPSSTTMLPFRACAVLSGHHGPVRDVDWEPHAASYVVSTSHDQTTRLVAPMVRGHHVRQWRELARPQVHGYDMSAVAMLRGSDVRHALVSGAEEKVVRFFLAPRAFVESFHQLACGGTEKEGRDDPCWDMRPDGVSQPALGLSNRPVGAGEAEDAAALAQDEQFGGGGGRVRTTGGGVGATDRLAPRRGPWAGDAVGRAAQGVRAWQRGGDGGCISVWRTCCICVPWHAQTGRCDPRVGAPARPGNVA